MLAGRIIGTDSVDSTTGCTEHDSCIDCIDCDGGPGGRGSYPRREGGLILLGGNHPLP